MKHKTAVIIALGVLGSEVLWQAYKRYRNYKKRNSEGSSSKKDIMEVLFFTEDLASCRPHMVTKIPCKRKNCALASLKKITSYMASAKKSLDVCMYFLTYQDLCKEIIDASRRGVVVRVIMDSAMSENGDSQTLTLRRAGIKIRMKKLNVVMHHKFAIIDNELLMSGSLNWTMSALFGNYDNIMITNHPSAVQAFVEEFEKMWRMFDTDTNYH